MISRPRRLRKNAIVRNMVAETRLSKDMFVYPYFVMPGKGIRHEIDAMPGIHHFSVDELIKDTELGLKSGINKVLLFGVGEEKTEDASSCYHNNSIVVEAIKALKQEFGDDLYIITDVCACAYTTHGHCGILKDGYVQNDETVEVLESVGSGRPTVERPHRARLPHRHLVALAELGGRVAVQPQGLGDHRRAIGADRGVPRGGGRHVGDGAHAH